MSRPAAKVALPLCRLDGHTCAACCWGEGVRRPRLEAALRRQGRRFRRWFRRSHPPGRLRLALYERTVRSGLDLLWAVLLLIPGLGAWLRPRLRRRMVCAFLGFDDEREETVGCLLHPTRWEGRELRPRAAFALLRGFACGPPDHYCLAARYFARAPWREQRAFAERSAGLDWYAYSAAAAAFRPGRVGRGGC